jgi:hypothetical protein
MFVVYDCGKKAQFPNHGVHRSWKNASFETKKEAIHYAHLWLGPYSPGEPTLDLLASLNISLDYNGYGSLLEIKEETDQTEVFVEN